MVLLRYLICFANKKKEIKKNLQLVIICICLTPNTHTHPITQNPPHIPLKPNRSHKKKRLLENIKRTSSTDWLSFLDRTTCSVNDSMHFDPYYYSFLTLWYSKFSKSLSLSLYAIQLYNVCVCGCIHVYDEEES
jgi:hypothetical protein